MESIWKTSKSVLLFDVSFSLFSIFISFFHLPTHFTNFFMLFIFFFFFILKKQNIEKPPTPLFQTGAQTSCLTSTFSFQKWVTSFNNWSQQILTCYFFFFLDVFVSIISRTGDRPTLVVRLPTGLYTNWLYRYAYMVIPH